MQLIVKNVYLYLSAAIVNLLGFSTGISFTWTSPMLPKLSSTNNDNPLDRPTTVFETSWIGALTSFGAIFGPLIVAPIIDKFGRKKGLLFLSCPLVVSLLMLAFSKTIILFYIARFIMGLGAGSVFVVLPIYLVEIAEDDNRGKLSCMMAIFICSGTLFTYVVGPFVSVQNFCLISLFPLAIFIPACLIFAPETPQFLASINDQINLKKTLIKLRGIRDLQKIDIEILDMMKTVEKVKQNQKGIKDLFQMQVLRKSLIISLGLIILQQFAGINAVLPYMQTIFEEASNGLSPEISVIIVGSVQVAVLMLTSSLVDILGRKILFLVSSVFSCLSLVALGTYFFLKKHDFEVDTISWLPVTSLVVFIIAFNIGLAPLPWTIMAELFPSAVKATASTITVVICMVSAFFIMLGFPSVSAFVGMDISFWFFATVCLIGGVGIWCFVPETKGKSLQEIQKLLGSSVE